MSGPADQRQQAIEALARERDELRFALDRRERARVHWKERALELGKMFHEAEARAEAAEAKLAEATTFTLNLNDDPGEHVTVALTCKAGQGPHQPTYDTWAVRRRGWCLDVDGDWVHEPLPSSRDAYFIARTRWPLEEALERGRAALARESVPAAGRISE